jgi:hypothetical protein
VHTVAPLLLAELELVPDVAVVVPPEVEDVAPLEVWVLLPPLDETLDALPELVEPPNVLPSVVVPDVPDVPPDASDLDPELPVDPLELLGPPLEVPLAPGSAQTELTQTSPSGQPPSQGWPTKLTVCKVSGQPASAAVAATASPIEARALKTPL